MQNLTASEQVLAGYDKINLSTQREDAIVSSIQLQDPEIVEGPTPDRWESHVSASGRQYWVNL
jgi:hypothetical protein